MACAKNRSKTRSGEENKMTDSTQNASMLSHEADYDGPILEISNLSISFFTRLTEIPAVMDFSCEFLKKVNSF